MKILFILWNLYQLQSSPMYLKCHSEHLIQDLCLQRCALQCTLLVILPRHIAMKTVLTLYFWRMALWMERNLFDHLSHFKLDICFFVQTLSWIEVKEGLSEKFIMRRVKYLCCCTYVTASASCMYLCSSLLVCIEKRYSEENWRLVLYQMFLAFLNRFHLKGLVFLKNYYFLQI